MNLLYLIGVNHGDLDRVSVAGQHLAVWVVSEDLGSKRVGGGDGSCALRGGGGEGVDHVAIGVELGNLRMYWTGQGTRGVLG